MSDFTRVKTKSLLPEEDFSYKKDILKKYVEEIIELDEHFYNLVNNIIVSEDQKGKIVDSMKTITFLRKKRDQELTFLLPMKVSGIVGNYNEQVEDMKRQQLLITYSSEAE